MLKNSPTRIAKTAKQYLCIQGISTESAKYLARGKTGFHELLTKLLTGKGTLEQSEWAWDEMFAFVKTAQTPMRKPLLRTSWTMAAMGHGDYVAKGRVTPTAESSAQAIHRGLDHNGGPGVSGPMLVEEVQARAFFDLQVQLSTDLDAKPVNDVTVEWPERRPRSSPLDGCIFLASPPWGQRISRRVTRSRSTSGVSRMITDRWARSWPCDASTARQPRSVGRSITSGARVPPVQIRCCPNSRSGSRRGAAFGATWTYRGPPRVLSRPSES